MGTYLSAPKTDKLNEHGSGNGLKYGVASMQGWREEMEDAHCAVIGLNNDLKDWSFFAVFDGHEGAQVSTYSAEHLLEFIINSEEFCKSEFTSGIRSGFLRLDDTMRTLPPVSDKSDVPNKPGSTVICVMVSPKQIFVANCGDSRAVICNSGVPVFSTEDHTPELFAERERIKRAGGYINNYRVAVDGIRCQLNVSRGLGDYDFKNVADRAPHEQVVSPEPEISVRDRDEKDEFLVLACDGIWDVMSNEDICNLIRSRLLITDDLEAISNQILDTCLYKGSKDNMSIVLVTFPGAPNPSSEAIEKEKNLEAVLERRVKDIISENHNICFESVMSLLKKDDLADLPIGGGIGAKQSFIKSVFIKLCPTQANSQSESPLKKKKLCPASPIKSKRSAKSPPKNTEGSTAS